MNPKNKSIIFLIISYTIFGFSFLFSKVVLAKANLYIVLSMRFIIAFLTIQIIFWIQKRRFNFKNKNLKYLLLLGIAQPIVYFICESNGVTRLDTSFVGIILALIPLVSFYMGFIFLKEKVRLRHILFALLSILGVVFTSLHLGGKQMSFSGFLFILGAVFAAAVFNVLSRKMKDDFDPYERNYLMFLLGAVFFTILALLEGPNYYFSEVKRLIVDQDYMISLAYLALISSCFAFILLNYGASHLNVATASMFTNLTTVVSILAGVFILHEQFSVLEVIGTVLIIISVIGMNLDKRRKRFKLEEKDV